MNYIINIFPIVFFILNLTHYSIAQNYSVGIPSFTNGISLGSNKEGFISIQYSPNSGSSSLSNGLNSFKTLATFGQIGSNWGVAYDNRNNSFYTSQCLRRHSGYGPDGSGSIYIVSADTNNLSATLLINLDGLSGLTPSGNYLSINTGDISDHGILGPNYLSPGTDNPAFSLVGKSSLGDIDIQGNTLWVVNTKDRQLIKIDITNVSSPSVSLVFPINTTTLGKTATNGELRPWGIEIGSDGSVYIGVVATAEYVTPSTPSTAGPIDLNNTTIRESLANRSKLKGYVFKLDESSGNFSQALVIELNYLRGSPGVGVLNTAEWLPWFDDYSLGFPNVGDGYYQIYPQPIIVDMEIIDDGSMLISIMDRFGLQTGTENEKPGSGENITERGRPCGDVVRVNSTGAFTWSSTITNKYGDLMSIPEKEAALGGIANLSGSNEFLSVTVDPQSVASNGIAVVSFAGSLVDVQELASTTGAVGTIYNPLLGAKGLALGDVELVLNNVECTVDAGIIYSNQNICSSGNPNILSFTNPATGNGSLSYQWQSSITNCYNGFVSIPDSNSSSYDPPNGLTQTTYFRVIVTNTIANQTCNDTSNCITISVGEISNISANVNSCNPVNNKYTLTGNITFTNPPLSGTLTIAVGAISQTFNAPFTSPQSYSLNGLTADGTSHTVTATFSADANCTNTVTYTAPTSCGCNNTPYSICPGESYTMTAQLGYQNYQWYTVSGATETAITGATNQTYVVTATGIYKWKAQDGNACQVEACCQYEFVTGNCASCSITNGGLVVLNCNDNGTLSNSSDDTYSFTLNPTGSLLGTSYTVSGLPDGNKTFNYGTNVTIGPYLIQSGELNITITDNSDINCKLNITIQPPQTCSNCTINPPVLAVNDNICPSRTGTINLIQGCGAGTFIQYSINNGTSWTTVKPLYSTTPITILARCVNSSDTTCKSPVTTVTTNPKKCTPSSGNECSLIANATVDPCNDNKTGEVKTDDYFTIQISANVTNGGSSNKYEVVNGADISTGSGGNILNNGGTNYGSPILVGQNKIFKADGLTSYQLVVRDINNNNCFQSINIDPVTSCSVAPPVSPCYPVPCVPISVIKN